MSPAEGGASGAEQVEVSAEEVAPVEVDPDQVPDLAAGFERLDHAQWQQLVARIVNRRRPEDRRLDPTAAEDSLRTRTVDGLVIEPLYAPDGHDPDPLGHPGVMPFVRGRTALRDAPAWDVRQPHDDPDPDAANEAVRTDLQRGVTSLWLTVGADGIAPRDLPRVLDGVHVDLAPLAVSTWADQDAAAAALTDVWSARDADPARLRGSLGLDPIGQVCVRGGTPDFQALRRWARRCREDFPQVVAATVDVRPYHDAGAGDVEELALAVAGGIAYVRELVEEGLDVEAAFASVEFRVVATDDQFLTIAKLRALRRLWARVAEVCEAPQEVRGARQHAVTSWRMTSRDDPYVNVLRGTIACFAAAVAAADAITVLPFDTAVGRSDPFSRRIARNTQILLAEESSVARVLDPAGGSWYVESLTDALAASGWAWFQELEGAGGLVEALRQGLVRARLAQVRARRDERLATRSQPLTGVSTFPNVGESRVQRPARPTLEPRAGVVAPLPRRRDPEVYERLRDRSRAYAEARTDGPTDGSLRPPTLLLACLGTRRDYAVRETFTSSFLAAGGILTQPVEIETVEDLADLLGKADAPIAVLCSSPARNGERGAAAARALREAGAQAVYLAGNPTELGEGADLLDGTISAGGDAVRILSDVLDRIGAPAADPLPDPLDPIPQGAGA